ncbi:hypothetical protein DVA86_10640 [Streptomyces armeniacus]|uniref:Purine catabolism PurC-like domain-containing protein n=1 Tax=Streptomyces armeniacus TaxID=83291 RepID=A0A345XN21_9ACTN|nr:PucR family transcriptional regulator ligand-binding domain-containing protein [Streptomyces armeniacus]AXK33037.1 hypothetical protein DVA86_10640 [Streptomyces armeniacus]
MGRRGRVQRVPEPLQVDGEGAAPAERDDGEEQEDLLGRTVRWAHVSQLTDLTGLLRGGELVLTTADALRGGAVRPSAYLAGLAAAGAAGLGGDLPAAAARATPAPVPDRGGGHTPYGGRRTGRSRRWALRSEPAAGPRVRPYAAAPRTGRRSPGR